MFNLLNCPRCFTALKRSEEDELECEFGHCYPVVEEIPVFLFSDLADNQAIQESLELARSKDFVDLHMGDFYSSSSAGHGGFDERPDVFALGQSAASLPNSRIEASSW